MAKALSTGSLRKYRGNEQDISVCALVDILSGSTSKQETFFCKFDLAYLPCRLHPYRTSALYSNRSRIEMSVQKPVIIKF